MGKKDKKKDHKKKHDKKDHKKKHDKEDKTSSRGNVTLHEFNLQPNSDDTISITKKDHQKHLTPEGGFMIPDIRDLISGRMLHKNKHKKGGHKSHHHGFSLSKFEHTAAHAAGSAAHLAKSASHTAIEINKETGVFSTLADTAVSAALSQSGHEGQTDTALKLMHAVGTVATHADAAAN